MIDLMEKKSEAITDEKLQEITGQIVIGQAVLVAHSVGLFKILLNHPSTVKELSDCLNLKERSVQAMISCACTMDFIEPRNGVYHLTPMGLKYFDGSSPTYYGGALDLLIQNHEVMNFDAIKSAILSNNPQADNGKDIFDGEDSLGSTQAFVQEIHQKASAPAYYWAKHIDLSNHQTFVDIAGGSGMHTIAACLKNDQLEGIVCDRKPVLKYTKEYISTFGLQGQINIQELDLWSSIYPKGDVFFLSDIFHDWDREQCLHLAKRCFDSLASNGKIILHEMLFNEDKTGPALTVAYNLKMLLWTQGQQYTFSELSSILSDAGFQNIRKENGLGNWSLIIAEKP